MGLNLEWKRFTTWNMNDYMEFEIDLVKKLTPDRPVTTNFMQLYDELDYRKMTDKLDVISWDSYPRFHNDYESLTDTFARSAFDHAVMRSMKKDRPFMLMESAPGLVNWHDYNTLCYLGGFPGSGLNELFGVTVEELDTYYPNDKNYVTFSNKKQGTVKDYAERIRVQDAEIFGTYVEDFYAGEAAATRKQTGAGWAYYTACRLDQVSITELIKELITNAGIRIKELPENVEYHERYTDTHCYAFYINEDDVAAEILNVNGTELLSGQVVNGKSLLMQKM